MLEAVGDLRRHITIVLDELMIKRRQSKKTLNVVETSDNSKI